MRSSVGSLFFALALGAACTVNLDEKHFKLGEEYLRQGQHQRAIEEYSRVVNFGQRSVLAVRAQMQIANIYEISLRDFNLAIRAYRDAIKRTDDKGIQMKAHWAVARIYGEKLDKPAIAADEYEGLYKEYGQYQKEGAEILLSWAKTLSDAGRFSEAVARYEEFRKTYPGHKEGPRTLLDEGQAMLADRNYEAAIAKFREVLTRFSGSEDYSSLVGESYYGLGSALESAGDLKAALEAYKQGLSIYPNKGVIELKIERVMKRQKEKQI